MEVSSNTSKYAQFFEDDGEDGIFQGLEDFLPKYNNFAKTEDSGSLQIQKKKSDISETSGSINSAYNTPLNKNLTSTTPFSNNKSINPGNTYKSNFNSNNPGNSNKFNNNKSNYNSKNPSFSSTPGNNFKSTSNKSSYSKNNGNSYKSSYKNNYSSYNRAPAPLSLVDFHKNVERKTFDIKSNSNFKKIPAPVNSVSETQNSNKVTSSVISNMETQKSCEVLQKSENINLSSTQSSGIFKFKMSCTQSVNSGETQINPPEAADSQKIINCQFKFKPNSTQIKRQSDPTSNSSKKTKWEAFADEDFEDFNFNENDLRQLENSQIS